MSYPEQQQAPPSSSNTLSILAIVFGAIAILFVPILFGVAGIACGGVARSRRERLSKLGLTIAIAGTVIGFALGALIVSHR